MTEVRDRDTQKANKPHPNTNTQHPSTTIQPHYTITMYNPQPTGSTEHRASKKDVWEKSKTWWFPSNSLAHNFFPSPHSTIKVVVNRRCWLFNSCLYILGSVGFEKGGWEVCAWRHQQPPTGWPRTRILPDRLPGRGGHRVSHRQRPVNLQRLFFVGHMFRCMNSCWKQRTGRKHFKWGTTLMVLVSLSSLFSLWFH